MCGIIGIYNHENAAELATLGLFAEQHRGQESCGLAVSDGKVFRLRKRMGLVKEVFTPEKLERLKGTIAIGHVRYPTKGKASADNSQPHVQELLSGPAYALASNGDITNYNYIRKQLRKKGVFFSSGNDGELLLKYIVHEVEKEKKSIKEAIHSLMKYVKGAFSAVFATRDSMYIFRDPYAIRPLVYGQLSNGSIAVASESCALDIVAPKWVKEVQPAELIKLTPKGIESIQFNAKKLRATETVKHCVFEHIYFARPDSIEFGENVYEVREKLGAMLADNDAEIEPDVVVPVPDSANFIALGYAKRKGIPFEMGLIRNHYVGRTFIKPQQTIRDESVKQKFNPLPNFFKGKKVVMVDDSIVRGTTIRKIVKLILDSGAKEIHLRLGSPPVKHSCYYGIDTPTSKQLIAKHKSVLEIEKLFSVTSLKYMTTDDLRECVEK
ncbi:MAG: amidophosphoribosyltransferase, partial [Candidatus Cloacimonetes bacterium]|nr:amidophosphoribosyltransferase [Candidatus Cloacimonadota bacterium]